MKPKTHIRNGVRAPSHTMCVTPHATKWRCFYEEHDERVSWGSVQQGSSEEFLPVLDEGKGNEAEMGGY